jgi:hypothetical protein
MDKGFAGGLSENGLHPVERIGKKRGQQGFKIALVKIFDFVCKIERLLRVD